MVGSRLTRWLRERLANGAACALFALCIAQVSHSAQGQVTGIGSQFNVGGSGLASPAGVAADGQGNLYIADSGNNRILVVTFSGSSFAAPVTVLSGLSGPMGVAANWSGSVYIADTGNNRILMLPETSSGLGPAVTVGSGFSSPSGVAVDSAGNLYIADTGNNRLVELPLTSAGFGSPIQVAAGFNSPLGVAVDAAGNLYVADSGNNRVVKEFHSAQGYLTSQLVGYGLKRPSGVSVDKSGNVYIADTGNARVVEEIWFGAASRYNSQVIVGSGFVSPAATVEDYSGDVYIADGASNQVLDVVTSDVGFPAQAVGSPGTELRYNFKIGAGTTVGSVGIYTQGVSGGDFQDAGSSSCLAQTYASVTYCGVNIAFTPLGSGTRKGAVVLYDAAGNALAEVFLSGSGIEPLAAFLPAAVTVLGQQLSGPAGVTVDGSGNLYIADTGNNRVVELPWSGNGFLPQTTVPLNGLISPMGMTVDGAGNLYVVSNGNDKVVELPWTGVGFGPAQKVGTGFYGPSNVVSDAKGNLYVTDTLDNVMVMLPWTGSGFGKSQAVGNYWRFPGALAVDGAGNVFFANPYFDAVIEVPISGQLLLQEQLQVGGVGFPAGLAADGNGNLYILDSANNQVLMLPWNGTSFGKQITVATGFNAPQGLALDGAGNLYVADTGNNQVVELSLGSPGSQSFANTYLGSTSVDSPRTITVENLGNAPLILESLNYPQDFPEGSAEGTACAQLEPVNPGGNCQIPTAFTPTVTGSPLTESIQIVDNSLGVSASQQSILLSGTSSALASQSITIPAIPGQVYGAPPLALGGTATSGLAVRYQILSGPAVLNASGTAVTFTGAGTVVLEASQTGSSEYAAAAPVSIPIAVAPAVLTVTPASIKAVYGSVPSSYQYSITGFVLGQKAAQAVTGAPVISNGVAGTVAAGTYTLAASQGTLVAQNYTFAFAPGTLTVTQATLKVSAASTSWTYGAAPQAFLWTLSGLLNGDTASVVSGVPSIDSAGRSGLSVGTFPITPSLGSLAAANYSFTFVPGVLTVTRASLTVTAASETMTYGTPVPATSFAITGFVAGDSAASAIQGSPAIAVKGSAQPSAGTYSIAVSQGSLSSTHYIFTFVPGTLTVNRAQLTVAANSASMVYGATMPHFAATLSGFVNGDTASKSVSGSPSLSTSATSQSSTGTYSIAAALGTLNSQNYSFSFSAGTLTIGKATLTVLPQPASMVYGGKLPAFSYLFQGFVNGDGPGTIQGSPSFTTVANSASPVGSYAVVASTGSLQSPNYAFSLQSGALAVTKAVLTVIPANVSMTYGSQLPAFSFRLQGFVNGDSASVVSGVPVFQPGVTARSTVGVYPLQANVGSLSAANYTFAPGSATIAVNKAVLTVTPDSATMTYGGAVPAFAASITGFVNGDTSAVVAGAPAFVTKAASTSPAGAYPVEAATGTLSAANYSFASATGQITIQKAVLTVTPVAATMTYGGSLPKFSYTIGGYVNGETWRVVSGTPEFTTTAGPQAPAGTYPLQMTAGTLSTANYTFAFASGQVVVNKAVLKVAPATASMPYGGALPAFTYTLSGLVNGDGAAVVSGIPVYSTEASSSLRTGWYPVTMTAGTMQAANYTFTFLPGNIGINKAVLTVSPAPASMIYGGSRPALTYQITGYVNGDSQSAIVGKAFCVAAASSSSPVGIYPITVNLTNLSAENYTFTATGSQLTVTPAVLTVSAQNQNMIYGSQVPSLKFAVSGLKNGDTQSLALTGSPALATVATSLSSVGSYAISAAQGSLTAQNYSFQFAAGALTVTPATLTITAANATMTAGGALPNFTDTASGFVNGDTAASATTGAASLTTTATSTSKAGNYPIQVAIGTLAAANYVFKLVNGTLTVNQ